MKSGHHAATVSVNLSGVEASREKSANSDSLITLLIPMRDFHDAKSRLTCLTDDTRSDLARRCFERALIAAVASPGFYPVVVSNSRDVAELAQTHGVRTVAEPAKASGFRSLLQLAVRDHVSTPAFGILMADLPYVTDIDLHLAQQQLVNFPVVLAPDRHGLGTNLLLSKIIAPELLRFGARDSFLQHLDAFAATGVSTHIVKSLGLGYDVDTNEDYRGLASGGQTSPVNAINRAVVPRRSGSLLHA